MTPGSRVLGVIAARGGSKGLPGKNLADLGGRPLVAWSVAAALGARELDRAILSSDDAGIIAAARAAGCDVPFIRPPELATDTAGIEDVLFHALDALGEPFEWIVLLQATSPLRTAEDIDVGIRKCRAASAPALVAVCESAKSPHWMFELAEDGRMIPFMPQPVKASRRQLLPKVYHANGALYVARVDWLRANRSFYGADTLTYVMPRERSVDIDTALDLAVARTFVTLPAIAEA